MTNGSSDYRNNDHLEDTGQFINTGKSDTYNKLSLSKQINDLSEMNRKIEIQNAS